MEFTKEMIQKARASKNSVELLALAKANGIEITEEQADRYYAEFCKSGELADEELNNVAGGGWCGSKWLYESGDTPLWKVNQRVRYESTLVVAGCIATIHGDIVFVCHDKGGAINKEFTYNIRRDDGMIEENVYESQIKGLV